MGPDGMGLDGVILGWDWMACDGIEVDMDCDRMSCDGIGRDLIGSSTGENRGRDKKVMRATI